MTHDSIFMIYTSCREKVVRLFDEKIQQKRLRSISLGANKAKHIYINQNNDPENDGGGT